MLRILIADPIGRFANGTPLVPGQFFSLLHSQLGHIGKNRLPKDPFKILLQLKLVNSRNHR